MSEPSSESRVKELRWTAQTHAGRYRHNNEDAFLALMFDHQEVCYLGKEGEAPTEGFNFVFAVSDGVGGAEAGEFASHTVLGTITNLISREFNQKANTLPAKRGELLSQFCQRVHDEVVRVSRYYDECRKMGATLSMGWFYGGRLHFAHIGDSRIYHFPKDKERVQLTEDHTQPGRLLREGKINEREARYHTSRNVLENSLGSGREKVFPQTGSVEFRPGDQFVFCSDGIVDGLWDRSIEKIIRTPPPYLISLPPAQRLVKEAMESSGRDNLTAIVVEAN